MYKKRQELSENLTGRTGTDLVSKNTRDVFFFFFFFWLSEYPRYGVLHGPGLSPIPDTPYSKLDRGNQARKALWDTHSTPSPEKHLGTLVQELPLMSHD